LFGLAALLKPAMLYYISHQNADLLSKVALVCCTRLVFERLLIFMGHPRAHDPVTEIQAFGCLHWLDRMKDALIATGRRWRLQKRLELQFENLVL
jgi:hypothetical protein